MMSEEKGSVLITMPCIHCGFYAVVPDLESPAPCCDSCAEKIYGRPRPKPEVVARHLLNVWKLTLDEDSWVTLKGALSRAIEVSQGEEVEKLRTLRSQLSQG